MLVGSKSLSRINRLRIDPPPDQRMTTPRQSMMRPTTLNRNTPERSKIG